MTRLDRDFAILTAVIAIGCAAALLWADIPAGQLRNGVAGAGLGCVVAALLTFFDWSPPRGQR